MFINTEKSRQNSYLFQKEAQLRSKVFNEIQYIIELQFGLDSFYNGKAEIKFNIQTFIEDQFFIEFAGKQINYLQFDDQEVQDIGQSWQKHRILLPLNITKQLGEHSIKVAFENNFDKTGFGLFLFNEAPHDKYIYSCFASNFAHTVFPCFDQPDLKAIFTLSVLCPSQWQVISNENPYAVNDILEKDEKQWQFPPTPPISTYLFCVNAGNWYMHTPPLENNYKNIQTNLYCRQSIKNRLLQNAQEITKLINYGLEYYEQLFEYSFPFQKYDQIFCPEFNYSGMENPGAVELTESYLFFEKPSSYRLTTRALTVLHELSHMWFGDLVTMKWWNDIWLNEAFAVLISYQTAQRYKQDTGSKLDDIWGRFLSYKQHGYEQDMQTFTHPIEVLVEEASESQDNFDSITYSKGSAVLHQLVSIIGEKLFFSSLVIYFKKFKWQNADMYDLFEIISQQITLDKPHNIDKNFSMERWIKEWIQQPSLNLIQAQSSNQYEIELIQIPYSPQYQITRQHTFLLTVFLQKKTDDITVEINGNIYIDKKSQRINLLEVSKEENKKLEGEDFSINAIILNQDDKGYFLNTLDKASLDYLIKNFEVFGSDLQKKCFILTLQQSCELGYTPLDQVTQCLIGLLTQTQTTEVQLAVIQTINVLFDYVSVQDKIHYSSIVFDILYSDLNKKIWEGNNDEYLEMIRENIALFAQTPEQVRLLYDWVNNRGMGTQLTADSFVLGGFLNKFFTKIHQYSEEDVIQYNSYWSRYRNAKYFQRIQEGTKLQMSEIELLFNKWIEPDGVSESTLYEMEYLMQGINNEYSPSFSEFEFVYYKYLPLLIKTNNKQFIKRVFKKLHPKYGNLDFQMNQLSNLKEWINKQDLEVDKNFIIRLIQSKIDAVGIKMIVQQSKHI